MTSLRDTRIPREPRAARVSRLLRHGAQLVAWASGRVARKVPSKALGRVRARVREWTWAARIRPRPGTVEQIERRKAERTAAGTPYLEAPRVSVIVQSFNQVRNIATLEPRLRATCADELIVCEDGSLDGSAPEWMRRLVGPNDFLLRSNDIHEIRAYNRAIAYSRGTIVCLMQDDDAPPRDGGWLGQALELFDQYPRLAVLGGWCGFDDWFATEYNAPWLPSGVNRIPTADPVSGSPLMFVENVNIGPYLIRREAFEVLGAFDLRFSPPGEPGITFEAEYCYRAWCAGYEVALSDIPVKRHAGAESHILPGGTSLWGLDARERNERANKALIEQMYASRLTTVQKAVAAANTRLVPRSIEGRRDR